jgi:hypothetical protein
MYTPMHAGCIVEPVRVILAGTGREEERTITTRMKTSENVYIMCVVG